MSYSPFTRKFVALGTILDVLLLDQISKWVAMEIFLRPEATGENGIGLVQWFTQTPPTFDFVKIEFASFFNLVMVWNQGISFGLLNNGANSNSVILIILAALISAVFLVWLWRTPSFFKAMALALVIGGAIGNIVDRLRFGAVIDFLDVHVAGYHWPAFNVADSCVVIGVLALILHSLLLEKKA